jgi:hypothetical protein
MLEGFAEVLKILAEKVSRKAVIIALAIIMLYMIVATPNPTHPLVVLGGIVFLSISFTVLQWILDITGIRKRVKENKDSEVDAAAGYVSTDRDFAYDYNSKSGNDGADGRYEIDVKPDEVFGMLGYSKPEDEYAFVIGKGVTSQEGRVRRVGDIASLPTTAPWLEEYTKNISYNRGGTPYRHHALAGQFDFHEVEDFGKNLEEFFGKYNLTSADIKSKFINQE